MTAKRGPGIIPAGASSIHLGESVWNVCRVYAGGVVLQPMRSRYEFPPDSAVGPPMMWAEHGNKLYIHPSPHETMPCEISWTGGGPRPDFLPSLNDKLSDDFMRLYHAELKRAQECA